MALLQTSNTSKGIFPGPAAQGAEVTWMMEEITVSTNPAANDTFKMLPIPSDHVVTEVILSATDLDTNAIPTITLSVGVLNAAGTDLLTDADSGGGVWITSSVAGQAGTLTRTGGASATDRFISFMKPTVAARDIGIKVIAASATFASGQIRLQAAYRAARYAK